MSRWTHVAGVLRIDAMPLEEDRLWVVEISNKLGKIVKFESPQAMWNLPYDKTTPMGSEGGIEYFISVTGSAHSLSRGTVVIHADLRDFGGREDSLKILNWLKRLYTIKYCYIRQGIIRVEDEGEEGSCIINYHEGEFEWTIQSG